MLGLDDREGICTELLHGNYGEIMQTAEEIQKQLDRRQNLHMQPRRPAFPAERVQQIAHSLVQPDVPDEKIVRRAGSTATVSMSFHDDFVQENAAFRAKAGLKCWITRVTDGKCCAWCAKLAGRYEYGEEPEEVYHRHDNCGCSVTYENGRQRQDVWSKRTWEAPAAGAGAKEPARLTTEQAAAKEAEHLPKRLTQGAESGTIDSGTSITATTEEIHHFIDQMTALGFQSVTGFYSFTERNSVLQEIADDFTKLHAVFSDVIKSLHLHFEQTPTLGESAYGEYDPALHRITLNPIFYNSLIYLQESYANDVRGNHHPKGTSYRAVIAHETGHAVSDFYSINGKQVAKQLYEGSHSGHFTRKQGDEWITNGLCIYAAAFHYDELIAESFAEYYNSDSPRKLCKDIVSHIKKLIERGRGII